MITKSDESSASVEKNRRSETETISFHTEIKASDVPGGLGHVSALSEMQPIASWSTMAIEPIRREREDAVIDRFLDDPNQESFATLFKIFTPQLVSFFRSRTRELASAEDLAQDVMLTVYSKAGQVRHRASFRAWLFKIARNVLRRHYDRLAREVATMNLADVEGRLAAATHEPAATRAFEFRDWMAFLNTRERELMMLRFVERWEYHEIAAVQGAPIGTVQWKIFNSKKKLARHLKSRHVARQAA